MNHRSLENAPGKDPQLHQHILSQIEAGIVWLFWAAAGCWMFPWMTFWAGLEQIYLVDIYHPIQIRKKTAAMSQVELIEEDLTGGAIEQALAASPR